MNPGSRIREPAQARSRSTHQAILEAAADCFAELGWTGATVAVIAERAGVSRGAAQHHFPTREDLVAATVEYVSAQQVDELRRRAAALPTGPGRVRAVVDMLLDLYTGRAFRSTLHLWTAASTDPALRSVIVPIQDRVGREAHRVAVDLLDVDESRPGARELVQATLDLARGLGLADLLTDDTPRRTHIAARWSTLLADSLPAAYPGTDTPAS